MQKKKKKKCRGGGGVGSGRGLGPVRGNWGQGGCEQRKCKNVRGTAVQSGVRRGGGGQGGCERRIEVIVKMQKKKKIGGEGGLIQRILHCPGVWSGAVFLGSGVGVVCDRGM